jgi:hypothetical protein
VPPVREILIGRRTGDHVLLTVRGRLFPEDPDWLWTPLTVRVGGFEGRVEGGVRADELRRFRAGLEGIHEGTAAAATLATEDGWLQVDLTASAPDAVGVELRLRDQATPSNELRGSLAELSRASLVAAIETLIEVERAYPVA